ncbi:hypothetical protein DRO57_00200 [Candidatus Bathyarchaeota archaeon]|nr:MAG: hypothetical protein DRO57_00200 [Candidatus Bathyarchaeota archaeon]
MRLRFPKTLVAVVLVLSSIYMVCGGIYVLVESRENDYVNQLWVQHRQTGRLTPIFPSLRSQIIGEGYVVGTILSLGVVGLLLPYVGLRFRISSDAMKTILAASILLLLISIYLTFSIYFSKLNGDAWP